MTCNANERIRFPLKISSIGRSTMTASSERKTPMDDSAQIAATGESNFFNFNAES